MSKTKGYTNRNLQLAMFVIMILIIGGFIGSVVTQAAMNRQRENEVEKLLNSVNKTAEKAVKKELKKQKKQEDKSPPLKEVKDSVKKSIVQLNKKEKKLKKKVPTSETTETSVVEETEKGKGTSTPKPTAMAEETLKPEPTATSKETSTPEPTATPTQTQGPPKETPTPEPTATPAQTQEPPKATEPPITVKVVHDIVMYKDDNEKEVLAEVKKGEKLTNVTERGYGMLKATYKGEEGFVDYLGTNYLDCKKIFSPVYEKKVKDEQEGTVCEEGVELRSKPGFTSKSKVIAILESGTRVRVIKRVEMIEDELFGYSEVEVIETGKVGYIIGSAVDEDLEVKIKSHNQKEDDSKSTETFWETGLTIKVVRPMKMYSGNTSDSELLLNLQPGEKLFDVQECTESNSGWLLVKCKRNNEEFKGFVQYLNTNYLDKIGRYDSVCQKELNNIEATINTNSVNLRDKPGITKESKVIGVVGQGTKLTLISYEEVVQYEKHGWFKVMVEETGQIGYVYGKFVDVNKKKTLKSIDREEDQKTEINTNTTIGSAITASEEGDQKPETASTTNKGEGVSKDSDFVTKTTKMYFKGTLFSQRILG